MKKFGLRLVALLLALAIYQSLKKDNENLFEINSNDNERVILKFFRY